MKFLFITSNNLATNPRLLKELNLASSNGFEADVMLFDLGGWSEENNKALINKYKDVEFIVLSAKRSPFFPWAMSSFAEKILHLLPLRFMSAGLLAVANSKRAFLLLQQIKRSTKSYDWVIAHNPAAFYPALIAARKNDALLGIDIEDYHPGESNRQRQSDLVASLMQKVLPKASYCSYASRLIKERVLQEINMDVSQQLVVINGFQNAEFVPPAVLREDDPLKLVWFSQNIDKGRGLEPVIPLINKLFPLVELHIIGNLRSEFEQEFLSNKSGIVIHPPKKQSELHHFLSFFDIGLAIDVPVNLNRDLALTNKIIAYAQAGLFVLATPTDAHRDFLQKSALHFYITGYSIQELKISLLTLIENKVQIRSQRQERFLQGRIYDWEQISNKLLEKWQNKTA